MRKIGLLIMALPLVMNGCYARTQKVVRNEFFNQVKIKGDEKIAVMLSDDGSYTVVPFYYEASSTSGRIKTEDKTRVYLGSGILVADKVQAALLNFFPQVERVNTKNKDQAIFWCSQHDIKFLVVPTILQWEDRNTPWSGLADKVKVKIELFDIVHGEMANSVVLEAHNEWATLTDKPPEDLLDDRLTEAVASMFSVGDY